MSVLIDAIVLFVLLEPGLAGTDFDLFNWAKKKDDARGNKDSAHNRDNEVGLVHELEVLDDNISAQTFDRYNNEQLNSLFAQVNLNKPDPSQRQPGLKKEAPPKRPPPPMDNDECLTDQDENARKQEVPEELRDIVENNDISAPYEEQGRAVRPRIRYRLRGQDFSGPRTSTSCSDYLSKKLKGAYKCTKNSIISVPKYVNKASDIISATIKINERGRLLALIEELNLSMMVVRKEFSSFTEIWSPLMEQALNYVGTTNLNKIRWNEKDEFDFRRDALHVLAAGYEFMRTMIAWRQNTLTAHAAYRLYLETIKNDLSKNPIIVDEQFIYQMEAIHNYLLFKSWLLLDSINSEPKLKFDYVSRKHDELPRNYESEYFRSLIIFQELYEPTMEDLDYERQATIDAVSTAGAFAEDFAEVDEFLEDFINSLDEYPIPDIELTSELLKFMADLKPEIQYNPQVYDKDFMIMLKEAKGAAIKLLKKEE